MPPNRKYIQEAKRGATTYSPIQVYVIAQFIHDMVLNRRK
jgi:hypothetical protein